MKSWWLMTAALSVGCAKIEPESSATRIVGGAAVRANEAVARSTVALVREDGRLHCTGSLLSARHVLTAAHCLEEVTHDELRAVFGPDARTGKVRTLTDGWQHEDFDLFALMVDDPGSPPNDIALVELEDDAPDGFKPVALLDEDASLAVGDDVVLAGFGLRDGESEGGEAGRLHKVSTKVSVIDAEAKEWSYGGTPGKSACRGDSGGPAFVKRGARLKLAGVTSRGDPECLVRGTYVDVRRYGGWLREAGVVEE